MKWCFFDNNRHCLCCRIQLCLWCRIPKGMLSFEATYHQPFRNTYGIAVWLATPIKPRWGFVAPRTSSHPGTWYNPLHFPRFPGDRNTRDAVRHIMLMCVHFSVAGDNQGRGHPARDAVRHIMLMCVHFSVAGDNQGRGHPARDAVRHITLMCVHFSVAGDNQGRGHPARDAVRHITLMCVHFSVAGETPTSLVQQIEHPIFKII